MRVVQLGLRVLELVAAAGLLALLILLNNIEALAGWVMRITPGVAMLHCFYAIYHLARPAGGRSPASSTAYQLFSGISDLGVIPLYAYGALNAKDNSTSWTARWVDQNLLDYFIPAVTYTFIGAGGLHLISLFISGWLGLMFRKITQMPPDMNPLEDHLTSRAKHKKNKSSIATSLSDESEKRLSMPLEDLRRSGAPYEDVSRPPSIPFQRTRAGSDLSNLTRNSCADFPNRQYQVVSGQSPRDSGVTSEYTRPSEPRSSYRSSYAEVSLYNTNTSAPRTSISSKSSPLTQARNTGKFTETWFATDSLISRTQKRNRAMDAATLAGQKQANNKAYEALDQRYDLGYSDSEQDENDLAGSDLENDISINTHPNPLGSNPHSTPPRSKTPYHLSRDHVLSQLSPNSQRVSGSNDIADERLSSLAAQSWPRNRNSSIQPESDFYSKPYGELKPATPPVMVGSNRQVSSGNDYDGNSYSSVYGRRKASGKVAEEGLAGSTNEYSHHKMLQEIDRR